MAGAIRSAWCGDLICCRTFSRCSDSISGPLVSTTSTVLRLARASATARCSTFSELCRPNADLHPDFFLVGPAKHPLFLGLGRGGRCGFAPLLPAFDNL